MAANDRPSKEVRTREAPVTLRVVQVREWTIRGGLIDPAGDRIEDLCTHSLRGDSH